MKPSIQAIHKYHELSVSLSMDLNSGNHTLVMSIVHSFLALGLRVVSVSAGYYHIITVLSALAQSSGSRATF